MERANKTKWDPPLDADAKERRQSFVIKRYIPVDDLQRGLLYSVLLPCLFFFFFFGRETFWQGRFSARRPIWPMMSVRIHCLY